MRISKAWILVVMAAATACGTDDDGTSPGRGSAACRRWQAALCGYVEQCNSGNRAECDEQYRGVTCADDATAATCADLLSGSACSELTQAELDGCDISVVADPAPAQQACDEYLTTVCASAVRCGGYATESECLADQATALNCDFAIAYTLDYEQCIREIGSLSCDATSIPDICRGVILVSQ